MSILRFGCSGIPTFMVISIPIAQHWSKTKLHNLIFDREIPVKCKSCEFYYICGGGNIFKNSIKKVVSLLKLTHTVQKLIIRFIWQLLGV